MSFFRRSEDNGRVAAKYGAKFDAGSTVRARDTSTQPVETSVPAASTETADYEAFGLALEENKQSSEELVASLSIVQDRVSTLLTAHSRSLNEVGTLRVECARLGSLLDYEGTTRRKLDQDNGRLASENKEVRADNAQLRVEIDSVRQEYVKLQALHGVTCEELTIIETRLADAERELSDRSGQFDEATAMVKRTQQELESRSRELATLREKLDVETTAHQLLAETSRRENAAQSREITRLNEEKNQLKNTLSQQEVLLRSLQASTAGLRQEIAVLEEKNRHLEEELEGLQNSTALQIAHMNTRQEALGSKAELAEKLLATANGRNRMTDEELRTTRAELKRLKSDLQSITSRSERLAEELSRARASGAESENGRRNLAAQNNELALKLRELEGLRNQRERDWEGTRRDLETRAESDRHEIGQLRTSLEIAKAEIRQLRTERAILNGQLEAARGERPGSASLRQDDELEQSLQAARVGQPVIDISERSLRGRAPASADGIGDRLQTMDVSELPPAE
ncbi:coiled-coil domain-containing protein [Mycoplana ramosa]|uniref:Crescentin n=1 Tax=Mycoplana ramosa TaxID=40837 RepID=A0ABW3YTB6_MYCRA